MFFCSANAPTTPDGPPGRANWDTFTPLEQYKLVRAQIEHENTVIGHRITWFLSFQGFMIAALFAAFSAMDKVQSGALNPCALGAAVTCLCVLGLLSAIGCHKLVLAALKQQDDVVKWWNEKVKQPPGENERILFTKDAPFPPLYDSGPGGKNSPLEMHVMFYVIAVVWVVLIICYWVALFHLQPLKCR